MNSKLYAVAVLPVLALAGCGYDADAVREAQAEQDRFMATQPFFNGYNAGFVVFFGAVALVVVTALVVALLVRTRPAAHAARARIREAEEATKRARIARGDIVS